MQPNEQAEILLMDQYDLPRLTVHIRSVASSFVMAIARTGRRRHQCLRTALNKTT